MTLAMAIPDVSTSVMTTPEAPALHDTLPTPASSSSSDGLYFERKMGNTETSYYLPSRQTGVNDMYLHLGFRGAEAAIEPSRVRAVWAILRLRHPLLAASVMMNDYTDIRFVYKAPSSVDDLLNDADANLEYRTQSKDALIHSYLNGPRTLSNTRLSYLIISQPEEDDALLTPPRTPSPPAENVSEVVADSLEEDAPTTRQVELLICAMHFIGDGMALHQFANDFFSLLGGTKTTAELQSALESEWTARWADSCKDASILPSALEDNIPIKWSKLRSAAASVDFQMSQQKLVGGQTFPRRKHTDRRTVVPTISFPEDRTKAMLKKCKANGVSISAALFAMCDVAWSRMDCGSKEHPVLMYSALNLRPYFSVKRQSPWDSYWFLSIGYFNVVLPSYLPADQAQHEGIFWHRARQAKEQSAWAAKNPLLISRTHEMAKKRGEQARVWAKEDDEKENGTWTPPTPPLGMAASVEPVREPVLPAREKAPGGALIGLSLLGNLDGVYKHANFSSIKLHTLTTGSRQRHGAMLLFGYTFAGKLWVSLGYDENGFAEGVVEHFWGECIGALEEFLA